MQNIVPFSQRSDLINKELSLEPDQDVIEVLEKALIEAKAGRLRAVAVLSVIQREDGEREAARVTRQKLWWHVKELAFLANICIVEWAQDFVEQSK
jgi:hypothetical protein